MTGLALLACLCLLTKTFPANSQPLRPLRPLVVRLDSGTTIHRPLVGLDTAAYRSLRVSTALDQRQLAERAAQLTQLRAILRHDSLATLRTADELRSTRLDVQAANVALAKQQTLTSKALALPLRPPLLLDSHFWTGTGLGAAAVLALKLFIFH